MSNHLLISCDYAQAELCSLAQVCIDKFGYSEMGRLINEGIDLHLYFVARMYDQPYEDLLKRKKEPQVKDWRQAAKAANFGFPGGLGVSKFVAYARDSYGVELEEHEAKRMKDAWLETYPEMRAYFNWISQRLAVSEYISIVQHRSGRTRGRVGYTDGCNTFFQGLTADGASMAVNLLNREAWLDESSLLYGARMIGFFYDEFFGSIPDKGAAANTAAAMRICEVMKEAMAMFTPDVKAKVEPALMRNWSKAAEPVFDSNGHLIPWEDAAS